MKKVILFGILVWTMSGVVNARSNAQFFIVGDGTAANETELVSSAQRGWGQVLPTYLNGVIVHNRAVAMASTRSYVEDGQWKNVLDQAKRKDYVVIQFGLNDLDDTNKRNYCPVAEMEDNLLRMVAEAKKKGLQVIMTTPISRVRYNKSADDAFYTSFGAYAEAVRRVAGQQELPLVDLEALTAEALASYSQDQIDALYTDGIHLTEAGALWVARLWAEAAMSDAQIAKAKIVVVPEEVHPSPVYANQE